MPVYLFSTDLRYRSESATGGMCGAKLEEQDKRHTMDSPCVLNGSQKKMKIGGEDSQERTLLFAQLLLNYENFKKKTVQRKRSLQRRLR